jgi:hypothetical protein
MTFGILKYPLNFREAKQLNIRGFENFWKYLENALTILYIFVQI